MKKKGKYYMGCCPFHSDKNPSFIVNIEKKFYYCFSCGSHGNSINFLMNYDKITFIEAIQELSLIQGIEIKTNININEHKNLQKNNLYQLMNKLCIYYQKNLNRKQHTYAQKFLQKRGINAESIVNFNIGFAQPGYYNIIQKFGSTLHDKKTLIQSGMIITNNFNQNKREYDRFQSRIMFPIRDISGNVIAFGGRIITNSKQPKYINSSDTNLFKKSKHLYGLYEARKKCKTLPNVLLVEGYMDVITLTQHGINYSVATLGTSITTNHIQLLYNITNNIICCYDGDSAGKKAAWRTLNIVLPYLTDNRQIYFIFLPQGEDPDSLIRKTGKNFFLKKIAQKKNISYFLFKILMHKIHINTLAGRIQLSNLAIPIIDKIPGQTLRLYLRQELGNKIGILDDHKLNQLLTTKKSTLIKSNISEKSYHIKYNIEHILVGLLIQNPKLAKLVPTVQELSKYNNDMISIFVNLIQTCKTYPKLTSTELLQYYRKNKFFSKLETLANWNHLIGKNVIEITFIDALNKLYTIILKKHQDALIAQDRLRGLTKQERKELWLLNKKLSKNNM